MRTSGRAPSKHQGVDKERKRNLRILGMRGHAGKDVGKGQLSVGKLKFWRDRIAPKPTAKNSQRAACSAVLLSVAGRIFGLPCRHIV